MIWSKKGVAMSWRRVRDVLGVPAMASLLLFAAACGGAEVEPAVEEAEATADMAAVLDGSVPNQRSTQPV